MFNPMTIPPVNVCVADDHPIVVLGIKAMLYRAKDKFLSGVAYSGDDVLSLLQQYTPHILLLDLNMPGKSYTELLPELHRRYANQLKIVIYTSYQEPELVKSLLDLGVHGYLLKTTPPEEFLQALDSILAGKRYISKALRVSDGHNQSDTAVIPAIRDNFQKQLSLSRREQEILVLISRGYTSQGIGETLYISKHMVETHRKNILRKLDFSSSTELVKFAVQQGLV